MLAYFQAKPDPSPVYRLADYLEQLVEIGADLAALETVGPGSAKGLGAAGLRLALTDLSRFIDRAHTLELAIAAKLGTAREAARRAARYDRRLSALASLFVAGSGDLYLSLGLIGDPTQSDFDRGDDTLAFLIDRGLVPETCLTLAGIERIAAGTPYRLCGLTPLGDLIDLCDAFLNAIDMHYGLYEPDAAAALPAVEAIIVPFVAPVAETPSTVEATARSTTEATVATCEPESPATLEAPAETKVAIGTDDISPPEPIAAVIAEPAKPKRKRATTSGTTKRRRGGTRRTAATSE